MPTKRNGLAWIFTEASLELLFSYVLICKTSELAAKEALTAKAARAPLQANAANGLNSRSREQRFVETLRDGLCMATEHAGECAELLSSTCVCVCFCVCESSAQNGGLPFGM